MAKTSAWGKGQRVLKFLFGLSNPQVAAAMVVHGFSEADLDEGWKLLRAVRPVRLDVLPPPVPEPDAFEQLLAWERDWMPLARASLRRHFPKLHQRLVAVEYPSGRGGKLLAVDAFLEMLERVERTAEGKKVRALLERRGVRQSVVDTGRTLVAKAKGFGRRPSTSPADHRSDWPARETALWDWYLEWGSIAWQKIKDRNLLRQLGFLAPARSAHASGEPTDPFDVPDDEPPAPAPAVAPRVAKKKRPRRPR